MLAPRLLASCAVVLSLACSDGTETADSGQRTTAGIKGARHYDYRPALLIDPAKSYAATIMTPKGVIQVELDAKAAPETVNNFVFLARYGYYDGLTFHRVEKGFVIQGGDPKGNGTGGPGYTIPDEASPLRHVDGAIAMGKSSAPNSAGSQFYVTIGAQPDLDDRYTVFGHVTSGLEVVRLIAIGDPMTTIVVTEK